ncbi:MAG: tRNA (adenosine(37)-N6)-dimethylallyltransferase MiaA, partial [bacterium]|nr:tRNA (adenosine(37)-N6)-dimethylallyltransferase MiaA [bacterium]
MKPKIIAVVGPTASGKTSLSIALAKQFNGEVISVDSRQIFAGMDIGTAKAEGEWTESDIEKGGSINQLFGARRQFVVEDVIHWGIDLVNPDVVYSVADFKAYAQAKIDDILQRGRLPILAGGTGFWLKAVIDDLDLSETPANVDLRAELETKTLGDLFARYKHLDPSGAQVIDRKNKRRLVRAIEVSEVTGVPFSEHRSTSNSPYDVLQIGLHVEREVLKERANARVDEMIGRGLVDEVRGLKQRYGCGIESMTGIGYRQICAFLDGETSLKSAIEDVKSDTRKYSKRQMTWFKRDERIEWIHEASDAFPLAQTFLTKTPA